MNPIYSRLNFPKIVFLSTIVSCCAASLPAADSHDWPVYLGDKSNSHFSDLSLIHTGNVQRLELAWTYHSADARAGRSQIQCNPLIIDGVLYGTSPDVNLFALDAATGRELWRFNPFAGGTGGSDGVNRGVVYWSDQNDHRLLFVAGSFLYAVDATSGKSIASFGSNGCVDLRNALGRDASRLYVIATTPGIVYRDLLIQGTRVGEGPGPTAPGHIRAYNIRTGQLAWIFHTIPQPGEAGYETWPPDAWKYIGGANCWAGMALDEKRGVVYVPTGSAAYDFWGGNRIGQNLFADCLLALDAATGRRLWHYQFVHHDLWDRDCPAPPNLLTVQHNGKTVDAVAEVCKSGRVFVFNRDTGEPLFPIEERTVPTSDLPGESTWPTQPLPVRPAPFTRQLFTADEITDLSPESYKAVLEKFTRLKPHTLFMPPSREGTIIFPGFDGGAEWGGAAVDPAKGILYVNANEMPWILTMVDVHPDARGAAASGQAIYAQICAVCHGPNRSGDPARAFPSLEKIGEKMKLPDIVQQINNGKGMMPSFAFLTQAQKESVARFLLGLAEPATNRFGVSEESPENDALGREPFSSTG